MSDTVPLAGSAAYPVCHPYTLQFAVCLLLTLLEGALPHLLQHPPGVIVAARQILSLHAKFCAAAAAAAANPAGGCLAAPAIASPGCDCSCQAAIRFTCQVLCSCCCCSLCIGSAAVLA